MKTLKHLWREILITVIFLFAISYVVFPQTVTIEHKESIKNALTALIVFPGTIYENDQLRDGEPVNGVRYFDYFNTLTKEQWGEVMIYLFDKGFKREQIQMLTEIRIGTTCPVLCPGNQ